MTKTVKACYIIMKVGRKFDVPSLNSNECKFEWYNRNTTAFFFFLQGAFKNKRDWAKIETTGALFW